MTGITRTSVLFAFEDEFAEKIWEDDKYKGMKWFRFPAGTTFSRQPASQVQSLFSIGNKFMEKGYYNKFSGSGSVKFKMDYKHLEYLRAVFDTYEYSLGTDGAPNKHVFTKKNGKRVPSICFKAKQLNKIVGGGENETILIVGVVAKKISFAQSSGNATIDVTLDYDYSRERIVLDDDINAETDYIAYDGDLVQWSCLNLGDDEESLEPVARTESTTISMSINTAMTIGCGTRYNTNYIEGKTDVNLDTTVATYDPKYYLQRMYSGGQKLDPMPLEPLEKNLKPIPICAVKSTLDEATSVFSATWVIDDGYVSSYQIGYSESKLSDSPKILGSHLKLTIISDADSLEDLVPINNKNKEK